MKKKHILFFIGCCVVVGPIGQSIASDSSDSTNLSKMPERNSSAPYDGDERIAKAQKIARQSGKLVLLQSSAKECTWCHLMHNVLTTDPKLVAKLESKFVYVLVDTTNDKNRDFYRKYADKTEHTLVLIVMDAEGKQLARKIGGECLDGDPGHYHISPDTLLKFLESASLKK